MSARPSSELSSLLAQSQPCSTSNISSLPSNVFGVVDEFCKLDKLWMSCRGLWQSEMRRELTYLTLTKQTSKKFLKVKTFRRLVLSSVTSPSKQVLVNLCGYRGVVDVSSLGSVHTLNLSGCQGVTDVSSLGSVHTLDLTGCEGVTDVSSLACAQLTL